MKKICSSIQGCWLEPKYGERMIGPPTIGSVISKVSPVGSWRQQHTNQITYFVVRDNWTGITIRYPQQQGLLLYTIPFFKYGTRNLGAKISVPRGQKVEGTSSLSSPRSTSKCNFLGEPFEKYPGRKNVKHAYVNTPRIATAFEVRRTLRSLKRHDLQDYRTIFQARQWESANTI